MAEAAAIFVSHAHEDNIWCRTFVQALCDAGAAVWYDEHNLGYGVLGEEIERELRARPIFVVILSAASVGKPWVRREMTAAITLRDRDPERIILPVVAEKTEIPLFWEEFKRVSGPGDEGLTAAEAAGRVVHTLAIVPADAAAAPLPASTSETAEAAWERGQGLRTQKRYEEALAAYERALALDPGKALYWNGKGFVLWVLNRNEEALEAYDQALALDPRFAVAWNNKGLVLAHHNRSEEALAAYERALALDPQLTAAWNNKGRLLRHQKRYKEALEAHEQALALDPQFALAWFNKGSVLWKLKRKQEALEAYNQALALDPHLIGAWNNKINLLDEMWRFADAREAERQRNAAMSRQ